MPRRLHYIDWLRVLAVLLLFPFHTSRVFNFGEAFYVKSPYLSMAINYSLGFVDRWHMPLLFLLAGCSAYFSLAKRSPGTFARERWVRLGVPLLFGILVVMPPQTYVGARFNSGYTETFRHYITSLDFLRWNIHDGGDYYGGFGVGQLWFILFLLVFSMVALPVFAWGRSERGSARIGAWARRLARPAWWLLPPAILWFAEGMPDLFGKRAVYYLVLFVLGFIVIADDAFAESAERHRFAALAIGTVRVRRVRRSLAGARIAAGPVGCADRCQLPRDARRVDHADRDARRGAALPRPAVAIALLPRRGVVPGLHPPPDRDRRARVVRGEGADRRGGAMGRHPGGSRGRELRDLRGRAAGRAATVPVRHAAEELRIDRSARLERLA